MTASIDMTDLTHVTDYVRNAARFLDLPLDEAQVARVAGHLARTRTLIEPLRNAPLADALEPAEIYCPAPFPAADAP